MIIFDVFEREGRNSRLRARLTDAKDAFVPFVKTREHFRRHAGGLSLTRFEAFECLLLYPLKGLRGELRPQQPFLEQRQRFSEVLRQGLKRKVEVVEVGAYADSAAELLQLHLHLLSR